MTRLQRWMDANGVKDGPLSERIGVSRVQILRLRTGVNRPSKKTALALAEVTQIPAGDLMIGDPA